MGTLMRIPDLLRVVVPAFAVGALLAPQPCRSQTNQATAATRPATAAASPMPMLLETRSKLGTTLLYAHKYDQAIAEFDKVLKSDPNHYDARLGMARAYYWTKRPREAAETLRPLVTQKPTPEVTALWNELAAASGDTVSALKAMDSALKERAGDLKLWEAKAGLLTASGSYAPAIKQLRELLKQNGDSVNIKLQLAHAYFTADRYPEAIEIYRNLMDDGPPVGREARTAMARIQLKACYLAEAKETLEKLMNAEPNDPRPYLGLVTLWILDRNLYPLDAEHLVKKLGESDLPDKLSAIDSVREWMFMMLGKLISLPADDTSLKLARGIAELLGENPETPTLRVCRQVLDQYAEDGPKAVKPDPEPFLASVRDGSLPRAEVYNLCHLLLALYAGEALVKVSDAYLELEPQDISVMLFRAEGLATTAQYADADEAYLAILDKMPENSKARRGLARNYPPEHDRLREQIAARGAVVSELPMRTEPEGGNFPSRNRLIAAMTLGTLVIEAASRSGSLITARLAGEYNREVFALPGRVDSPFSQGPHNLIRDGAKLVQCLDDILDELGEVGRTLRPAGDDPLGDEVPLVRLTGPEQKLIDAMDGEPRGIEELAARTRLPLPEVMGLLTQLQLKAQVSQLPGQLFIRRGRR